MDGAGEKFTYTAKRGDYLSIVIAFGVLIVLEAIGADLLIALLVEGWLKWVLLVLAVGIHVFVMFMFVAPLFTHHRLTATQLKLRYSYMFRADIPRKLLAAAEPTREKLDSSMVIKPFYHKDTRRLNVAFSRDGQVLLHLAEPTTLRIGLFKKAPVSQILVNIDRRDDFLKTLALPLKPGLSAEANPSTLPV